MVRMILVSITLLLVGAAQAGTDIPWWQSWRTADEVTGVSNRLFTEDEKRIIQSYFEEWQGYQPVDENKSGRDKAKKKKNLPPGLQKKLDRGGELPPGWQKKVARGEVLDVDLYRQSRSLPEELLDRLPTEADGTELRLLNDRVVRIIDDTRAILDVLRID